MAINRVAASRGFGWYAEGWSAFREAMGSWVLAAVGYLLIMLVLNFLPLLGPIVGAMIGPGLLAGFLVMARAARGAEEVRAGMLFRGLSNGDTRGPLLVLGAVALAGTLLAGLILVYTSTGEIAPGGAGTGTPQTGGAMPAASASLGGIIGAVLVALLVTFALLFAIPLVTFQDMDPATAMRQSFMASIRNLAPVLLFLVLYLILGFIAMIPVGLGFLVLLPVGAAAAYQGYREIFPEPAPAD
ncbi:BPSS1780 family membrane protein [Thiohalorhabdus methylotrophus]|uniref:BPSS1780 family membrane protein n=1 Tax=Thiohalorhabdus methylotrophus TaxID=3242694 RepID=A0ABV4TQQ0_9GAMM